MTAALADSLTAASEMTLRTTQLSLSQIPNPQKLWEIIYICGFQLLSLGVAGHIAADNTDGEAKPRVVHSVNHGIDGALVKEGDKWE